MIIMEAPGDRGVESSLVIFQTDGGPTKLRTLIDNGDFDSYWRHHTAREHQRLCPAPDQQEYALTA